MVVMPDADLDMAADALIGAGYGSAGERCMAVSVAVPVGEETANRLVARLQERIKSLKVGHSLAKDSDFGPVVTARGQGADRGLHQVREEDGASLLVDGRGLAVDGYDGGFWVGPTLFDNVTKDMKIYREEIFGPVLSVLRASDYDEALRLCSENEFGNGVAIFTRDGDAARDFASRVQVGMVGINVPIPVPIAYYTFGGWKASGFGDLNQHGADAFRFYTKTKTVTSRWPSGIRQGASFIMPEGS
jgi:malonate-semialdehyde dehydrogenase (acetylating)/methylmalonate-semialdehyde dehydrogenase